MKKLIVLLALVALTVPLGSALASDVPDGADCTTGTSGYTMGSSPSRGAVCVNDGNGTVLFYIGGNAQAQSDPDREPMTGACGAIIVGGMTVAGNPDWDRTDADGRTHHCD